MPKPKYKGPERRRYIRLDNARVVSFTMIPKNLKIKCKIKKAGTENISASGLKLISKEKIPVNTFIEFRFGIPEAEKPISGIGKVIRCERDKRRRGKESYILRINFVWMSKKNTNLIDRFVRKTKIHKLAKKLSS